MYIYVEAGGRRHALDMIFQSFQTRGRLTSRGRLRSKAARPRQSHPDVRTRTLEVRSAGFWAIFGLTGIFVVAVLS